MIQHFMRVCMAHTTPNNNLQAIVLAAGKSSRFKTGTTKLLEKICGQEIVLYSAKLLEHLNIPTTFVVGFHRQAIQDALVNGVHHELSFAVQEQQLGTGHAIICSKSTWFAENILIINGDVPLVTAEIINELYTQHQTTNAGLSFVTAHNADPSAQGYGRIVKDGNSIEIVEARDFKGDTHQHCCINAGIYIVKRSLLDEALAQLTANATTQEFYFTDIVKIAHRKGHTVTTTVAPFDLIRGINTIQELWVSQQIKRAEIIKYWMEQGIQFSAPQNAHIDIGVTIGSGTRIASGVQLLGATTLGTNCTIHEFCILEDSTIADNTTIYSHSIIRNSHIGSHTQIGPFAHIHHASTVDSHVIIGNFVELKNSCVGAHTKAKHLTYLGDAQIGSHVNIGAGTITCNHNGSTKNTTVIHDHAYVGSNNSLVAPLTIGQNAFTAAGSTITQDVPADALALGRAHQVNKENYAHKLRNTQQTQHAPKTPPLPEQPL